MSIDSFVVRRKKESLTVDEAFKVSSIRSQGRALSARDQDSGNDDTSLIFAARSGDPQAITTLYNKYGPKALGFARTLVRSEHDAADVMHEAFIKTLNALRNGNGPHDRFQAYLIVAVRSAAAEWWKKTSREQPAELHTLELAQSPAEDDGLNRILEEFESHRLLAALQSLPTRWQKVLWYSDVLQEPPRRIALVLGISPNAVSALTRRARKGLREAYSKTSPHEGATQAQNKPRLFPNGPAPTAA